jgi:hypothetical protein
MQIRELTKAMRTIKVAISAIFVVVLASTAYAQETTSRWAADPSGCQFWDPSPLPNETLRWSGRCVGGFAEGHGTLSWYSRGALAETDVADFVHGKLNGHGVLRFSSGQSFDGQFRDQRPNGFGTLRANDGEIFSGKWTDGCFRDGKRRAQFNAPNGCNFSS